MCFIAVANTLHDAYDFAQSLDHRGKDSTGIAAIGEHGIDIVKWIGGITKFGNKGLQRLLPRQNYHTFMVHGRYKTKGDSSLSLLEAHPHFIGGNVFEERNDFTVITGADAALIHNGQIDISYLKGIDNGKLKTSSDSEATLHYIYQFGIEALLQNVPGSFTLAYADRRFPGVQVARDRFGFMPGYLAIKDGNHTMASESRAYRDAGAKFVGDIMPGSVISLFQNGNIIEREIIPESSDNLGHCFFQYPYFANPHSILDRLDVRIMRVELGEKLAEEFPISADFVTSIPESPEIAARAYGKKRRIPFIETFYKIDGARSFLQPTQQDRQKSISNNLHILPEAISKLRGKRILVIDDSIIRGTVTKHARNLLFETAKVDGAEVLIYTPPMGILDSNEQPCGCTFGVDMPPNETTNHRFIARGRTMEEVSREVGMPVHYISSEGMYAVFERRGMSRKNLCTACIGGRNPLREYQELTIGKTG